MAVKLQILFSQDLSFRDSVLKFLLLLAKLVMGKHSDSRIEIKNIDMKSCKALKCCNSISTQRKVIIMTKSSVTGVQGICSGSSCEGREIQAMPSVNRGWLLFSGSVV